MKGETYDKLRFGFWLFSCWVGGALCVVVPPFDKGVVLGTCLFLSLILLYTPEEEKR